MSGQRIGSMIGAVGGLVFIMVNASSLPGATAIRVAGAAAFAFTVWFAVIRKRPDPEPDVPSSPGAMRVYWLCVGAEVLAIPLGAVMLNNVLDLPELTLCWVVFVVGAHFLPFARAFGVPLFFHMGWTLVALGVGGGALTLAVGEQAADWTGVLAGAALLVFAALGAWVRPAVPAS